MKRFSLVLLLLFPALLPAWTDKGHRKIPAAALRQLPADVPVLRAYASTVIDAGPEPDRWRVGLPVIKEAQEPDHFIHVEMTEFLKEFPATRPKFIEAVYAEAARTSQPLRPEAIGFQPYIVLEIFERLRVSFAGYARQRLFNEPTAETERRIAFYAGWLSHYVTDGAQPHHASIHYDGWQGENPGGFTTQRGIHYKFEGAFVERNIEPPDLDAAPARRPEIRDVFAGYIAYLRQAAGRVRRLYELDKDRAFDETGTPEGKRFVVERMAAGRDMLAAVWTAAWEQAQWQGCLPFEQAAAYVGRFGCVTGTVVNTSKPPSPAAPLYLNFCEDYRACAMSVMIGSRVRGDFPEAEKLAGRKAEFVGMISLAGGRPVLIVNERRQLREPAVQ